jgi:hypothetical protein
MAAATAPSGPGSLLENSITPASSANSRPGSSPSVPLKAVPLVDFGVGLYAAPRYL